jgi:hypothetical protein
MKRPGSARKPKALVFAAAMQIPSTPHPLRVNRGRRAHAEEAEQQPFTSLLARLLRGALLCGSSRIH